MAALNARVAAIGRNHRADGRAARRRSTSAACLGAIGMFAVMISSRAVPTFQVPLSSPMWVPRSAAQVGAERGVLMKAANVYDQLDNPVKTVAETLDDFYKAYAQPPLLPMYRPFLIDFLTQTHLAMFDSRFKYDAVFALGMKEYFDGLMGTYDKMVAEGESTKIWNSMLGSVGLDGAKVAADADAMKEYAKSTPPAEILKEMESAEGESVAAKAFAAIRTGLYTSSFSIGIFKIMEGCNVEVSKANVEEWAKGLKISPSKISADLETYRQNKNKLQKAEEMIREVEIREKKKLAERLEQKAKALAAKAQEAKKEDA